MARRSARLQKRSPTPTESADRTSGSNNTGVQSSPKPERLQSVVEDDEPTMKTPQRAAGAAGAIAQSASKLPQLKNTPTPHKGAAAKSLLPGVTARTPKNRTPIKPAGEEMHPAHHHASTAKVLDEARWLGFQALGAYTAPPKATVTGVGQETPSKTPVPASQDKMSDATRSPKFTFRFTKSPSTGRSNTEMSPNTRNIIKAVDNAVTGGRGLFGADEFTAKADITQQRKTAVPKGKMTRFSDVHMAEFKKMDSIANHASAFRADPNRFKVVDKSVKKSPSKVDLDKAESSAKTPNKLKRTQSKMDMASPRPASSLKRTQSKMEVTEPGPRLIPTPLKRTQSKMDMTTNPTSAQSRIQSTVRLVPPTRDGPPPTDEGNPGAKRFKRTEADDVASTRHVSREVVAATPATPARPARKITSQTALPRLASRLLSPTKASLARTQSAKAIKTTAMMPPVFRSPSTNPFSPTNIGHTIKEGVHESIRKTSNSLQRIRSILRTPSRKFSNNPTQIAAGTHMSPPPGLDLARQLPVPPATAPVKKHVNFTNSTLERAVHEELGKSPSPMKLRAGSEVPSGAVIYPTIQSGVEYPELPKGDESPAPSPSRRLTFGDITATATMPGAFSFESDQPMNFGPSTAGTVRMVRKSNASSLVEGKKRKHENVEESSDKENSEPATMETPFKKMKPTPAAPPKTPTSVSKLPRRTPQRIGSISKSRLAFLATPKRGKV